MEKIILASQSPRRKELLKSLGLEFDVVVKATNEIFDPSLFIDEALMKVAKQKAEPIVEDHPSCVVISADTIVWFQGQILGKPKSKIEAFDTLKKLSGQSHEVKTGVYIYMPACEYGFVDTTVVRFRPLSDEEITSYIKTKNPLDKAGSYGIQECDFVDQIIGSYNNVVGLPTEKIKSIFDGAHRQN